MPAHTDHIILGKITTTSGIKGYVRLRSFATKPAGIFDYDNLQVDGHPIRLTLVNRLKNGLFVGRIDGVDSIEAAELLRDKEITICKSDLPSLQGGDFYVYQLRGCLLYDDNDQKLGEILDIKSYGAGDIIEYKSFATGKILLAPFSDDFIVKADIENGKVYITNYTEE